MMLMEMMLHVVMEVFKVADEVAFEMTDMVTDRSYFNDVTLLWCVKIPFEDFTDVTLVVEMM